MTIRLEDVRHMARLAHLELTDEEESAYPSQLAAILDYIERIRAVDVSEVPPTSHTLVASQPLREDEVRPSLTREEALRNAPDAEAGHFRVPRVLD